MRIIKLIANSLVSSNVTGSTYSEFNAATSYSAGNKVKVSFESNGTTARFPVEEYESLTGSNVGNYPPDDTTNWLYLGAENRGKMFDEYTNTQTENTSEIEVEISSNNCNAVGLFNLQAKTVTFTQIVNVEMVTNGDCSVDSFTNGTGWSYDAGNDHYDCDGSQTAESELYQNTVTVENKKYQVVFTISNRSAGTVSGMAGGAHGDSVSTNGTYIQIITAGALRRDGVVADADFIGTIDNVSIKKVPSYEVIDLSNGGVETGWYGYYFSDVEYKTAIIWEFVRYSNSTLRINIEWISGELAKCGVCAVGYQLTLGNTLYGLSLGTIDYSIKETDDFGRTYLDPGESVQEGSFDFWITNAQIANIKSKIRSVLGEKIILDGNNPSVDYESLINYCFIKEFSTIIPGPNRSKCSIEYQGLI